ncbi:MAG: flagellar hook-length control protein FliK [Treponema sp.]|nr:flagellar hook-length control protein FliK [Treponema sp.]
MLTAINPTHVETPHPEKEPFGGEFRLDGVTRKKGRKNSGAGVFAKLLAGLVNKKTLRQPGVALGILDSTETGISMETAGGGKKAGLKAAFPPAEGKGPKNFKETLFLKKERPKETILDQNRGEFEFLNFGFFQQSGAEDPLKKSQSFIPETVSLKNEYSVPVKETSERKVPFKKGETTEDFVQGEARNAVLQFRGEAKPLNLDGPDNRGETKKTGRKRNLAALEIHDLRSSSGAETGTLTERGLKGAEEIRNGPVEEITLDLRPESRQGERSEGQKTTSAGQSFEQLLARELQGDLSADIVKQAAVILRDGGEGTIRLSLKPETLGKVKIHLEMAENRISGHIFVESEEALRAFEREIHTLEQSFRDSGFEASLNAALDYKNDGQRWKEKEVQPFFSERLAASYEESSTAEFSGNGSGFEFAVNVFA